MTVTVTATDQTGPPATAKPYIAALRAGDLFADPTYQRDLDTTRVERMSSEYDRTLLGVLEVSAREDGRYAIIDGQHRWAVVERVSGIEEHLACQVHTGLSQEDEARLFLEIDTGRRNLTWWDRWRARRGRGDPSVLGIDEVLKRHQLQVNPAPEDGNIRATEALETIVDDLGDLQLLDSVLIVLTCAFGRSVDAFDGGIMQGVALVLSHYDADELDIDRLVVQLRDIPPRQLRARAIAVREAHRGTVPRLCAVVIVERYNTGRGRKVEPFLTRVPSNSKAGAAFNRDRKERAAIRRWAERYGHDIAQARNIPPSVRRAYAQAQARTAALTGPNAATESAADDHPNGDRRRGEDRSPDPFDAEDSPDVGVPDRAGVRRALANGRGLRWVMDAYGLDYQTARALRAEFAA